MFLIKDYLTINKVKNYDNITFSIKKVINELIFHYFEDKPIFNKKDISLYFYDDHLIKTNVEGNFFTLYLEINQPKNFKNFQTKWQKRKENEFVKNAHLTLKQIKRDLKDIFLNHFSENILVVPTKYGVLLNATELINDEIFKYDLHIIPCFTYTNKNKVKGVVYYNDFGKEVVIDYPKVSIKNFKQKNKDTKNLYENYVVFFKNLFLQKKDVKFVPFELFETLFYNIPNELFNEISVNNAVNILNYLRNINLKEIITIDEQDKALITSYRTFSYLYLQNAIKQLGKLLRKKMKN